MVDCVGIVVDVFVSVVLAISVCAIGVVFLHSLVAVEVIILSAFVCEIGIGNDAYNVLIETACLHRYGWKET